MRRLLDPPITENGRVIVSGSNFRFYCETPHGVDVAALRLVLELIGAEVFPLLPPRGQDDNYVIADMGSRSEESYGESTLRGTWHGARVRFDRPFRMVGLVHGSGSDSPPGADPVPVLECLPALIKLINRRPRRISPVALNEQKKAAKHAQTRIVLHFLESAIRARQLVRADILKALNLTSNAVTHPELKDGLRFLREEILGAEEQSLRETLTAHKDLLETRK